MPAPPETSPLRSDLRPAVGMLADLVAGGVTSEELVAHLLARIGGPGRPLNAVVTVDPEAALGAARRSDDRRRSGAPSRPLEGLPVTVKDTIETAGMRTTAGAPELSGHVPEADAPAVARLRAAGAVVIGKTNTPLYAAATSQTHNDLFGTTCNPWDPARTAGGSSGGGAAAVAAGLSPLDLASDIAGSIRGPAHFCGVYGMKPSRGVVPLRGHIPGPPGSLHQPDLAVLGPLARSVADLRACLRVVAGPDVPDARGWRLALPPPRRKPLPELRVAWWEAAGTSPLSAEVAGVLHDAVDRLVAGGARVLVVGVDLPPPIDWGEAVDVGRALLAAQLAAQMPASLFSMARAAESRLGGSAAAGAGAADRANLVERELARLALRHRDWIALDEVRLRQRGAWERFFGSVDVLLTPAGAVAAFPHDVAAGLTTRRVALDGRRCTYLELLDRYLVFGLAHLPVVSLPAGRTAGGLPAGLQAVGRYLDDWSLLASAEALDAALGRTEFPSLG